MQLGATSATPFARDVAAAATSLATAAELLAAPAATREEYVTALGHATTTSGLLAGADGKMYAPVLEQALRAASSLASIAFNATASTAGAAERFDPPAAEVVASAVAQARTAAEALQNEAQHVYA